MQGVPQPWLEQEVANAAQVRLNGSIYHEQQTANGRNEKWQEYKKINETKENRKWLDKLKHPKP